jgi:NADPH-dependent curcumin reductase CurA
MSEGYTLQRYLVAITPKIFRYLARAVYAVQIDVRQIIHNSLVSVPENLVGMLSGAFEDSLPYRLSTVRARQIIKRAR